MKQLVLGGGLEAPAIALGCMRINSLSEREANRLLETALENGVNFFDHADIYGGERRSVFSLRRCP